MYIYVRARYPRQGKGRTHGYALTKVLLLLVGIYSAENLYTVV